jgi:polyphosphate kinase
MVAQNNKAKKQLRNKELSWLSFNERILQEAADPTVPLIERLRFLGIHSSNQDEFFRVRVATLKRLAVLGKSGRKLIGDDPKSIIKEIQKIVKAQHRQSDEIYQDLLQELAHHNIFIISEKELDASQGTFVRNYFRRKVRRHLIPVMLDQVKRFPTLREDSTYLAVSPAGKETDPTASCSLIEVPTSIESRFLILPSKQDKHYIILLDDVIRYCLTDIFTSSQYNKFSAYAIKVTRDAEIDIDEDLSESVARQMAQSLKQRKRGNPVRFVYDARTPKPLYERIIQKLKLGSSDTLVAGGRYHNLRDLVKFPSLVKSDMIYEPLDALGHRDIQPGRPLMDIIREKDLLIHYPYQTFDYMIDFLREAAIDPAVTSIKMTIYRAARFSGVMNALINAARNGKSVMVVLELKARFDEEANLNWGDRLQDEGVRVIYGVPGLKVHSKLCLVTRKEKATANFAVIGTGNFNEDTAQVYGDHALFTADKRLTQDVSKIFTFYNQNYKLNSFAHLVVSPFNMRKRMVKLIQSEIKQARAGKPASIQLKLNNLVDPEIIQYLYKAGQAGVEVQLNVRSMFSLVTGTPEVSDSIEAISIVDRFLEHTRIFVFGNGGDPLYFISSADLMQRNLDKRVEVMCPIFDKILQAELQQYLDLQWRDNTKARVLDNGLDNSIRSFEGQAPARAQYDIYNYLMTIHGAPPGFGTPSMELSEAVETAAPVAVNKIIDL